jgi:hypothetical protein
MTNNFIAFAWQKQKLRYHQQQKQSRTFFHQHNKNDKGRIYSKGKHGN